MADFEEIIRNHVDESGNIPTSAINAIVTAIRNAVGNEFVDKERYKAKLSEIDALKERAETAEDNATTAEKWKEKYDAKKAEFDAYKKDVASKETLATKRDAYKALLKDVGISDKRLDSVLKVSDLDSIELDDKGKIKGADKLAETIKNEWSDFIVTESKQGVQTETPPGGGGATNNYSDIRAMTARWHAAKYGETKSAENQNTN